MSETLDGKPRRDVNIATNMENGLPICPHCGCNQSTVENSFPWKNGKRRRRRVCDSNSCALPFFTIQDPEEVET